MDLLIVPIAATVVGLLLVISVCIHENQLLPIPTFYWGGRSWAVDLIGLLLMLYGTFNILTVSDYVEIGQYPVESYSITYVDVKGEKQTRCEALLEDGRRMEVDLRDILEQGDSAVLIQYENRHPLTQGDYRYDLIIPATAS